MAINRRQAYLKALGIEQWVHRASREQAFQESQALADADAAAQALTMEENSTAPSVSGADATETLAQGGEARVEEHRPSTDVASLAPETNSSAPVIASPGASSSVTLPDDAKVAEAATEEASVTEVPATPFASLYGHLGQGGLVVAQLCDPYAPDFSAQEHQLFHNILRALGWPACQMRLLKWPLDSQLLTNDQASMEIMLSSFLKAQVQRAGVARLIVFGEDLARHFNPQPTSVNAPEGRPSRQEAVSSEAVTKIALPSLSELLRRPEQKAKVWSSLKPFRS